MKKECLVKFVEFYNEYEKISSVKTYVDEGKEIEQVNKIICCYKNLKRFCNPNYVGMLFVKATIYNEDRKIEFEMYGEDYEDIKKEDYGENYIKG